MSGTAVERYEASQAATVAQPTLSTQQLQYIAGTELVPKAYRNNMPAIMACVLTGRALGLDEMTSLRMIYVVDGKATLSAELMVMAVRRHGHSISGESSADQATAKGRRADTGDEMSVTWTMEDAKRAGLQGKQNWVKYPQAMLWARAVSQLVRMLFPDALLGLAYTPEEMGDDGTLTVDVVADEVEAGRPLRTQVPEGDPAARARPQEHAPLHGPGEIFDGVPVPVEDAVAVISKRQLDRLFAIQNESGVSDERCKEIVLLLTGATSRADIPKAMYDPVIAAIQGEVA